MSVCIIDVPILFFVQVSDEVQLHVVLQGLPEAVH